VLGASRPMRIVAGSARGRRLVTPSGLEVRPTTDRVREAVFNALGSLDAIVGARVLDLFAGSGALGIEALSRGAAHATFVDSSPQALRAVQANLDSCGFDDRATVVRADALGQLERGGAGHDLVLLDPPYAFDDWPELMDAVWAAGAETVVVESDRGVAAGAGGEVLRERRYGGTVVTIASCTGRAESDRDTPEDRT
jgi:16S rRNA (guanine966-N2)-methyltransferase